MAAKKTRGRQKIEMKRIEDDDDRMITFSKRRSGIYKKASELVTLTGAEIGILIFSPSGKPFSFGHPSIEAIANRFFGGNQPASDNTHPLVEAHRKVRINELNQVHNELLRQLDEEKEREKILMQMRKGKEVKRWWEAPVEQLNMKELIQMNATFEELNRNAVSKLQEKTAATGASSSSMAPPPMHSAQTGNPFATDQQNINPSGAYSFPHGFNQGGI